VLLLGKSCVFRTSNWQNKWNDTMEEAVCKKDFKPSTLIDSTELANFNYPVVFHYQKPKCFGHSLALNHIVGLTMHSLDSCPPMPDSTKAIHIYVSSTNSSSKFVCLGVYYKTSINEDATYRLTYPVSDSKGIRVVVDSGAVSSTMHWKMYEASTPDKFRKQAEDRMTKQMEDVLLRDVVKKMERN